MNRPFYTQYWHQPDPPEEISELLSTHRSANPGCTHRVFDRASAAEFIAARFGARELKAFLACAVPAMQADYFRYCALHADAGFYADADMRCRSPVASLVPEAAGAVLFVRSEDIIVNGGLYFARPGHPLMRAAVEAATESIERRISNNVWMTTGPGILSNIYWAAGLSNVFEESALADSTERTLFALYRAVALRHADPVRSIFDGCHFERFENFDRLCPTAAVAYKATAVHWTKWPGSIFLDTE
jgi:mannosyltransferase OCH1-like enzyme